jgi:hypothetical protein
MRRKSGPAHRLRIAVFQRIGDFIVRDAGPAAQTSQRCRRCLKRCVKCTDQISRARGRSNVGVKAISDNGFGTPGNGVQ